MPDSFTKSYWHAPSGGSELNQSHQVKAIKVCVEEDTQRIIGMQMQIGVPVDA